MRALAKQLVAFFIFVNVCGLISMQTRAQASAQGATTAESRAVISVNITKPLREKFTITNFSKWNHRNLARINVGIRCSRAAYN